MSVRIAVIGAGIMGADHARIVAEDLPGAVLQVVCDAAPERARKVAETHGAGDAATEPLATIRRSDVDAVLIASPDETHAPLTLAAIEAGKPVLCEKPLSQQSAECLGVVDAEVRRGRRFVQVGFMRRFDPSYRDMKAALDDGSLGRPIMMHNFHRNVEVPASFTPQMAITNSAPHEFDIGRFVLGTDYRAISVFQPASGEASKAVGPVFMVLETEGGSLVNIEVNNNAAYGYDVRGELVGTTGSISLNPSAHTRRNGALMAFERYAPDWRARFAEGYRLQDKAFVQFVRTAAFTAGAADAWDGYCATRVAEAGLEALAKGLRVTFATAEKPPLYRP
jgi:myo-inositol 2-dehydrogenase/D-chiro-inositol 1-dehydrogenase